MRSSLSPHLPRWKGALLHNSNCLSLTCGRLLVRRKAAILGFAAAIFCLVAAYTFLKTPVYEGVARLQIDPNRSASLGLDDSEKASASVDVDGRVKTEVAIIQSDTVAMQVMKSLGLYANPHFAGKDAVNGSIQDLSQLSSSQRQRLLERFNGNLIVKVLPSTQVVEIRFRSSDPVAGDRHRQFHHRRIHAT